MRFYRDPLVRRFVSGSAFAAAFIYVAVRFFDVDWEVVKVFVIFSILFVIGLIVLGFFGSIVLALIRRMRGRHAESLLDRLPEDSERR
ncbi:MAG: hypothetical protein KDI19_04590 [Pseudomonadales bacterium]|nr:hypothetical protein [Pseudomonadales bacterium]